MDGLGWQEIILILVVLLIVFGPKKLPEIAKQLGEFWREFTKAASTVAEAVESPPPQKSAAKVEPSPPKGPEKVETTLPLKSAESDERQAIMDIARKLNINMEGKSIKEIAQEVATKIEEKEE